MSTNDSETANINSQTKEFVNSTSSKKIKNITTALDIINGNQKLFNIDINIYGQINNLLANSSHVFQSSGLSIQNVLKDTGRVQEEAHNKYYRIIILNKDHLLQERLKKAKSMSYKNRRYKCESCIIGFNFKENLQDHLKRKHSEAQGLTQCSICKQTTPYSSTKEHYNRHYTRYECKKCLQRYVDEYDVLAHYKRKHTKRKHETKHKIRYKVTTRKKSTI